MLVTSDSHLLPTGTRGVAFRVQVECVVRLETPFLRLDPWQ